MRRQGAAHPQLCSGRLRELFTLQVIYFQQSSSHSSPPTLLLAQDIKSNTFLMRAKTMLARVAHRPIKY